MEVTCEHLVGGTRTRHRAHPGRKQHRVGGQSVRAAPFHREKTASFYVHPGKQVYHCHGCSASGDVFRFIQLIEGVDFKRARTMLAERAGVSTSEQPLTREQKRDFARRKARAEREAEEFLAWLDGLAEALHEHREVYFRNYHRMKRSIRRLRETDDHNMEKLALAVDMANT
jgi:DNA primase